ncbi:MAG: DEAD/DEAH box helicase family protein [Acidobacteriota bacterium]|nr:DEAD/DEAH box helicase family protein [Acidobacteriota bacterium]
MKSASNQLRELLTPEEYASARASTPNAHYTSPDVIRGVWSAMEHLGVRPGMHVLEPSMGIGHFFGLMPESMSPGTRRTGIELDSISARIASKLYPDSNVRAKPFEESAFRQNFFDAAVGNIPFGNYPVADAGYRRTPHLTKAIHDYFLAKTIDLVRPGGIVALITSRFSLDKQDSSIRRHLSDQAVLLGAIRLPSTTFRVNAGTDVTTDILFLQKRSERRSERDEPWLNLREFQTNDGSIQINEYFARAPEMMLGRMAVERGQYATPTPYLAGSFDPQALMTAISRLPEGVYVESEKRKPALSAIDGREAAQLDDVKDGGMVERSGRIYVRRGNQLEPIDVSVSLSARIAGMLQVRDAAREVFRTQLSGNADDSAIVSARKELNSRYDVFVSRYGPLSAKDNLRGLSDDPDQPLLLSLEDYDMETGRAAKTAIFFRRTLEQYTPVERTETSSEALLVSLNETGQIDWDRMEQLTGRSPSEMQAELGSLVYQNPDGGRWETADRYLSGNVREKLGLAEAAGQLDSRFRRSAEALRSVQPPDLEPTDIEARLGSPWIPTSDVRSFLVQLLEVSRDSVKVGFAESIATWTVETEPSAKYIVNNTTVHGTRRFRASELVEQALNGRTPTAYDEDADGNCVVNQPETIAAREKQQQLKDRFRDWVWEDKDRATRLARDYNHQFNNIRLRDFNGSHLSLPGMNRTSLRDGDLAPHQKNAVWRILEGGSPLLAHVVGAGKTWTMTAAAMELRRLGLAKKPMFVVPNHLVAQWGAEFLKLYPQANLFIAGKDQFSTGKRQEAMARIATGNYDAVIVSHRSFEFLPVSDAYFNRFVEKQVAELDSELETANSSKDDNRPVVKELEKAKKRLIVRLKKRADRDSKDRTLTFEQLGVDQLFVDEADLYKNLAYTSKMTRIAGLPNSDSNRSFDMFLKIRYLQEEQGGRGAVFATGTPISNSLAEMYTMIRYLAPQMLEERKVNHFDSWAANFAEAVTSFELSPDGAGYRMNTRFAKFINLPELLQVFRCVADVQTADMLNLPRPELQHGRPAIEAAPASPELKAFIRTLTERAEKLKTSRVDPAVDNMLKITGEGRKAALDLRLVLPDAGPSPLSKVNRAVERIAKIWGETKASRSTQLVFSDLSTPNPDRFNIYDDVRSKLMTAGVPDTEIAFIHDAQTDSAKKALFESVNAGRVRVLLGSTEKMGAGTNVQRRLVALHHLDAPWRPRDIEQREGRILRQGNENREVQIYRYVTEGSFDGYMWQTLETKARFIHQVMRGETSVRSAEDLDSSALTYAEIKAIASGNPAVVEKIKVDTEIRKLDQLRSVHANQQRRIKWEVRDLPRQIGEAKECAAKIEADVATRDVNESGQFSMKVGNRVFTGKGSREDAANAFAVAVLSWRDDHSLQPRASFRGFEILSRGRGAALGLVEQDERLPEIFVRGQAMYSATFSGSSPVGTVQSIEHTLRSLDKLANDQQTRVSTLEKELADYQAQSGRPFEHEARLQQLLARQAELERALDLDKGDQQAIESDPEAAAEREPLQINEAATSYMREAGGAIKDMAVTERKPPESGPVTGRAVARMDTHVAIATAANSFVVVQLNGAAGRVQVGERITVKMQHGLATLEEGIGRGR